MEIRPLDASDPDALAAWHAAHHEAHRFGLEHASPWMLEEMRAAFLSNRLGHRDLPFGGYVDGRVVVTGLLQLPLLDNLTQAHVDVATPPAERRRGHGAAMLAHLTGLAVEAGRATLLSEASWTYEAAADGSGTANADFLTGQGFTLSLVDVKRLLPLPVDGDLLDRLAAEASDHLDGYTVRSWSGPVPDDVIDGFGRLVGQLITEAPMGEDQDFEAEVFDAARIRERREGDGRGGAHEVHDDRDRRRRRGGGLLRDRGAGATSRAAPTSGARSCSPSTAGTGWGWPPRSRTSAGCRQRSRTAARCTPGTPR